ncbi:MAG: RNA polymerase sigma factor [Acidimicrobiales bacterium]
MTRAPAAAEQPAVGSPNGNPYEEPGERATDDGSDIAASREDPERFAAVFDRHFDGIHRYLARRVGSDLADDLASETFVCAFRARTSYDTTIRNASPWLYQIATNLVRSHWRSEQRRIAELARHRAEGPPVGNPLGDPETATDSAAAAGAMPALAAALTSLRPEHRDPLLLLVWAELTYEQIAAALDLPVGTVRSRLSRARAILRERLQTHLDPEATNHTPREGPR